MYLNDLIVAVEIEIRNCKSLWMKSRPRPQDDGDDDEITQAISVYSIFKRENLVTKKKSTYNLVQFNTRQKIVYNLKR